MHAGSATTAYAGDAVVRACGLTRRYGERVAVDGIDLAIAAGECVGLLGPNGAGKTTTMRMLLGLVRPSAGTISVFGLPVPERARVARARIGVVPQLDNLDPDFTVEENLLVYASYFQIPRRVARARVQALLEFASLSGRRHERTDSLSGGMQRRLTIARALVNEPALVVLDEPTTGLDPQARHLVWERLGALRRRGVTQLLTTHYMEEAERLCDRVLIMDHGRILAAGPPPALVERHVEPEVVELRDPPPALVERLAALPGIRRERHGASVYLYTRDAAPLLALLRRQSEAVFVHRPTGLEDVFLRLTGRELRE